MEVGARFSSRALPYNFPVTGSAPSSNSESSDLLETGQMLLWGIGQICVPVSACRGGIDRYLCHLTPRLSMLIYRLDLSLLINDILLF